MAALALVEMLHHSMRVTRVAACAVIANLLQIRADRPGVPPPVQPRRCCCRKSMPIEARSETLDMSCSDGDGKDCPVESLAFILTAADNRLGSMARKTVDLSEWALINNSRRCLPS